MQAIEKARFPGLPLRKLDTGDHPARSAGRAPGSDRPFLTSDTLTLADIPAGTALYRYFSLEIGRPDVPNAEAWYARLQQRQAYREHVMVPFDDLKGDLDF